MFKFLKKLFSDPPLSSFAQKIKDDLIKYPLVTRDCNRSKLSWYFTFTHPEINYAIEYSMIGWYGRVCILTPEPERHEIGKIINKQFDEWNELQKTKERISIIS